MILAMLTLPAASCNLLTPLAVLIEPTKRVEPEFDKLPGKKVAVLVWTEPATLFDYPHTRFELATFIGDKLYAELGGRDSGTAIVDPRDVEDFIQKRPAAQIDPPAVGKQFDADYVIYLEVLQFQLRDPNTPQFLRGRIEASVSVHDVHADAGSQRRYDLITAKCEYPDEAPVALTATNSPLVREATYRKFAETVARKFYGHTIRGS
jgi:hypothetical protein